MMYAFIYQNYDSKMNYGYVVQHFIFSAILILFKFVQIDTTLPATNTFNILFSVHNTRLCTN